MARPRKSEHEKRTERLAAPRFTLSERVSVEEAADNAGLSVSEYQRQRILSGRTTPRRASADASMLVELNRIGVNLNQIARVLNRGDTEDPQHIGFVLKELHGVIERIA